MEERRAICISAAGRMACEELEISQWICEVISDALAEDGISCKTLELKKFELSPCLGCGRCSDIRRCGRDKDFNRIYEEILGAEYLFFVSPRYAPIPAKLCMLMEKMQQATFLHLQRDKAYQSELHGKLAGIISFGEGGSSGERNHKLMVNDTIARTLLDIQVKVVPYNSKWDTGIFFQKFDWKKGEEALQKYVEVTVQTSKSLYAIL